jgi:DNA-binding beta-propeller fold protein YncE
MMATDAKGHAYVTELGPTFTGATQQRASLSRITVRDDRGQILSEWGAADPEGADLYFAPHGIAIDSRGNVYVGEVAATFSHGMDPGRRSPLHKYARL